MAMIWRPEGPLQRQRKAPPAGGNRKTVQEGEKMERKTLYISIDVDEDKLLGKIACAIKLEDELRETLSEIKRLINLKEEQE